MALGGLLYLLFAQIKSWVDYLIAKLVDWSGGLPGVDAESAEETLTLVTQIGVWATVAFTVLVLFFLVWRFTGGLICGYFGGKICDMVIRSLGWNQGTYQTTAAGEVVSTIGLTALFAAGQPVLGLALVVPVIGPLVAMLASGLYASFLIGCNELRDPLQGMGMSKAQTLKLWAKHFPTVIGLGLSNLLTEPLPLLGGIVHASESIGRIGVARQIMFADGLLETNTIQKN